MKNQVSLAAVAAAIEAFQHSRIYGAGNIAHYITQQKKRGWNPRKALGSIAQLNRHTGMPHEHKREIARRLRKEAA